MPLKAYKEHKDGQVIDAAKCTVEDRNKLFFCLTPGCEAVMKIVNVGSSHAYFRTLPSSPNHISDECNARTCESVPYIYDESEFTKEEAFKWLFKKPAKRKDNPDSERNSTTKPGNHNRRSLGTLYPALKSRKKTETYNKVLIDDILADNENHMKYQAGLSGYKIVECTYYKKEFNKLALIFNYPTNYWERKAHVRILFDDKDVFKEYYEIFKTSNHKEKVVIAGDWSLVTGNSEYNCECYIHSKRQIYISKNDITSRSA